MPKRQQGFGLVEVLIGASIITLGIVALIQAFGIYVKFALNNDRNVQAAYLAEEGLEVATFLRDGGWGANYDRFTIGANYYISWNGSSWATTTTEQNIDGIFWRKFVVDNVYRDANDKIASSGTLDPNTKKVTVTVAYKQGVATTTKTMSTYLTDLYGN